MRSAWALLALAGCNQVFGLQSTQPVDAADAAFFDAPPDAPFACPPPGGTPEYSPLVHQIVQDCQSYTATEDGTLATALCPDETYTMQVSQSDHGAAFTRISDIVLSSPASPRIAPEGDELFVVQHTDSFTPATIEAFRRTSAGGWEHAYTVDPGRALNPIVYIGAPTRGPKRRMMISVYNNFSAFEVSEIELDATSGRVVHAYTSQELGSYPYFAPYLSPDGLRMYYSIVGQPMEYYERASLDDIFMSPRTIQSAPLLNETFMTADCARLYIYSGDLRSLFWLQQR